jgi:hypothetical protein
MQRSQRPIPRRTSTRTRRSFLELEQVTSSSPQEPSRARHAAKPRKDPDSATGRRALPVIVKDYKEALTKLDQIEAELADWLGCPVPVAARADGPAASAAPAPAPSEQNSADLGIL